MAAPVPSRRQQLSELIDAECQFGLQVGCLVIVDDVALCQLVKQRAYLRQHSCGLGFVGQCAQVANGVAGSLCIIVVASLTGCSLADALQR